MSLIISRSSTTEAGVIAHWGSSATMSLKELLVEASRCLQYRGKSRTFPSGVEIKVSNYKQIITLLWAFAVVRLSF